MAETAIQKKFESALKITPSAPWSLLPQRIPYNEAKYRYPIMYGTMRQAVMAYEPIIKAAILYDSTELNSRGFRMVRQKTSTNETRTYLEARCEDDTSFVVGVHKRTDGQYEFRAGIYENDANGLINHTPVFPFKDMNSFALSCCCLALWPDILQIDYEEGAGKIRQACTDLVSGLAAVPSSTWTSDRDIPEAVKDSAYYLDAVMQIMQAKMIIHCGNDNSDTPQEIESSWFNSVSGHLTGGLLVEDIPMDWSPIVVVSNGTTARVGGKCMTIADAKAEFASLSAHRNWTPAERELIPNMPDDMPVMPEVLRMARRYANTRNDKIPAVNFMWRGETGFGKSTGIRQFACILNRPLLTMTAHPGMEAQEVKSQFVPADEPNDGIELDQDFITVFSPLVPFAAGSEFSAAMSYVNTLDADAKNDLFSNDTNFFDLVLFDQDEAETKLFGKPVGCDITLLTSIYHRVELELQRLLYESKLAQAIATRNGEKAPVKTGPEFRHVVSPYISATRS